MPYIQWTRLPAAVRSHLQQRLNDRLITEDDMIRLAKWARSNPEVPEGEWRKNFGSFTLAGEGAVPKTFLLPGQPCRGRQI